MPQPSVSPVRTRTDENGTQLSNTELVKRVQSLAGKVEGLKNELAQVKARLNKVDKQSNVHGQELITENN